MKILGYKADACRIFVCMENGMNGPASFVGIIGSVVSFDLSGWARLRKRWTRWQCEIASLRIRAKTASGHQFVPTLSASDYAS
jgi:hypothetical protein